VGLKRTLTLRNAIMLVVGNVVGAGIFTTSGFLATEIGHPLMFLAVWVVGGLLTLCGALTYAELGAMLPRAGGDYQYLKEAYGPAAGFVQGWLSFWIITPGSIAALAIALAAHAPGLSEQPEIQRLLALAVIAATSFINYRGVKLAGTTQDLVTAGSLLLLLVLVIGGAIAGQGSLDNFGADPQRASPAAIVTGSAMIAVIFTYSGWFASAYVGSEVRRPERNVPLSLIVGTLIVTVLYAAVNGIYLYALPLDEMSGASNVAELAAARLFAAPLAIPLGIAIVLAIAGCVNASVMTGARICYAMARDGAFFRGLGAVHPRFGTPHAAIMIQAAIAGLLVALGTFEELLGYVVFAMLLCSMATGVGLFVLRVKRPDAERPYRAKGYPVVPAIFVLVYGAIAGSIAWAKPWTSLIGVGIALTAVPFYLIWKKMADRR
jgi:APA family basic amino acid/polyamine antiporter